MSEFHDVSKYVLYNVYIYMYVYATGVKTAPAFLGFL